jgi:hypothetical protein
MNHKAVSLLLSAGLVFSSGLSRPALAQEEQNLRLIQYSAPQFPDATDRGAPRRTTGAGSRGCNTGAASTDLTLLTPATHTALTTTGHPTFYWYVDNDSPVTVRFSLIEPRVFPAVVDTEIEVTESGVVRFEVPETAPALEVGKQYRWTVAVICDPNRPSTNIVAKGLIQRAALPSEQLQTLQTATLEEQGLIYAEAGYWHDALDAIALAYQGDQDNPATLETLLSLLEQGGITTLEAQDWSDSDLTQRLDKGDSQEVDPIEATTPESQ